MQNDTTTNFSTSVREAPRMPDFVLTGLLSSYDGTTYEVIAVHYGETGYTPTTWGRQTKQWIDEQNKNMEINVATQMAYYNCSVLNTWANYSEIYRKMVQLLEKRCTGIDPMKCDDVNCPRHGKGEK